jgi:hypothetical protein
MRKGSGDNKYVSLWYTKNTLVEKYMLHVVCIFCVYVYVCVFLKRFVDFYEIPQEVRHKATSRNYPWQPFKLQGCQ